MATYKNPKCDCGNDLVFWEESMYEIRTPITQNGQLSKRRIKKVDTGVSGAYSRLHCQECGNEYDYKKDDNGRSKP